MQLPSVKYKRIEGEKKASQVSQNTEQKGYKTYFINIQPIQYVFAASLIIWINMGIFIPVHLKWTDPTSFKGLIWKEALKQLSFLHHN